MLRGDADDVQVAVDLVYTTATPCRSVTVLPSSSDVLATSLLPTSTVFRGNMQMSKAASGDGCALYLTIKGVVLTPDTDYQDSFDVARTVHQQLTELLSSNGLALARAAVALDGDKLLTVSLTAEDSNVAPESVVTVQEEACKELLNTLQGGEDTDMLLPTHVETSALNVTKLVDADDTADCVVALEVAALVPRLNADAEAFQLLKTVDEKMESFFAGQSSAALASANVQLYVAATAESETLNLAVETGSINAAPSTNATFNPPSYKEALGIFALVAVLVAMMMGVVALKKRNENRSRERYERANRVAQIRRVSIRMSQNDQNDGQNYEGEEDSLL